ncbi:hypothetical protein ACVDFE_02180 [Lentzea chajnantorensis]
MISRVRVSARERMDPNRITAAEMIAFLHAEADRTGDSTFRVSAAALRRWKHRGHISPGRGYLPAEVVDYLDRRAAVDLAHAS